MNNPQITQIYTDYQAVIVQADISTRGREDTEFLFFRLVWSLSFLISISSGLVKRRGAIL